MATTTPEVVSEEIQEFCREIEPSVQPRYVPVRPKDRCLVNECVRNTEAYILAHGGTIQYGWIIWESPEVMLEAEFHAVWLSTEGEMVDITPKPDGERQILFLPDRKRKYEGKLVDNKRKPLNTSPEVISAIQKAEEVFRIKQRHFKDGTLDLMSFAADVEQFWSRIRLNKGTKLGRNAPCFCGSGRKFKKCCGRAQ